jgi:CBS-domain-containing membrane protein
VQSVAEILLKHRISGLPVVGAAGELVGIVSEGDLIRRAEGGTEHHRSWWLQLLMGREALAMEYVKEHALRVADVMTRSVVTIAPETPARQIAELLERKGIKRVPVVQNGKIVGIVSRANLLQALAGARAKAMPEKPITDTALREAVMARLDVEPWAQTSMINVTAEDGVVDVWGIVDSDAEKKALGVAVEGTPGVRTINDHTIVRPFATTA